MVMEKREGLREGAKRVLDAAARERRQRKALELLEQDNHIEEPQSDIKSTKRPHFGDEDEHLSAFTRKKKRRLSTVRSRGRKTLEILLDEEYQATKGGTTGPCYFTAASPPSRLPCRKFCNVCGFKGIYNCVICSIPCCSRKCFEIHTDTRCMKWVT
ncbi:Zinc finger HIT domain-containing protein 1 [Paragonimus westermani]|uniref:Zinc finger HIT domain-containing protein 1 n=1 Tax=Paragonimus westermani TaxID=34504 RepID=A0A8T0DR01_9TREM|nr:Zinc finger HIT domain-containing protein 1 [Paragonimus westermani]